MANMDMYIDIDIWHRNAAAKKGISGSAITLQTSLCSCGASGAHYKNSFYLHTV